MMANSSLKNVANGTATSGFQKGPLPVNNAGTKPKMI
jgi:hypothetical protein